MTLRGVSALHPEVNFILGIGQPLGSIAAGLPQNRGRSAWLEVADSEARVRGAPIGCELRNRSFRLLHAAGDFHLLV